MDCDVIPARLLEQGAYYVEYGIESRPDETHSGHNIEKQSLGDRPTGPASGRYLCL